VWGGDFARQERRIYWLPMRPSNVKHPIGPLSPTDTVECRLAGNLHFHVEVWSFPVSAGTLRSCRESFSNASGLTPPRWPIRTPTRDAGPAPARFGI
jgi:hypothetical protein